MFVVLWCVRVVSVVCICDVCGCRVCDVSVCVCGRAHTFVCLCVCTCVGMCAVCLWRVYGACFV